MKRDYATPDITTPAKADGVPRLTYNVKEAAEALGISTHTMYNLINREGFPTVSASDKM